MQIREQRRVKPAPSPHQKQMRFFAILFLVIIAVVTGLAFWLLNRSKY